MGQKMAIAITGGRCPPSTVPVDAREEANMYAKLLVPLDGSIVAEAALAHAEAIAGPLDVEILLLSVVDRPREVGRHAMMDADYYPWVDIDALVQKKAEGAQTYLAKVAEGLQGKGLRVSTVVAIGDPAGMIVEEARKQGAGLIVMTTHGRGALGRFIFGSVSQKLLEISPVPVFLVRWRATL